MLAPAPTSADLIDYDTLFADKAEQLTQRTLTNGDAVTDLWLDHGVIVTKQTDGSYLSFTTSGSAPGCFFEVLISLTALAQRCPGTFTQKRTAALGTTLDLLSDYLARNAYPPSSKTKVKALAQARIKTQLSQGKDGAS